MDELVLSGDCDSSSGALTSVDGTVADKSGGAWPTSSLVTEVLICLRLSGWRKSSGSEATMCGSIAGRSRSATQSERINDGLAGTSFLVLCCSDIGAGAGAWTEREWMSALARQLDGANVHILPVRLTGGTSPPILADVKYADLVADWQRGVDEICDALG